LPLQFSFFAAWRLNRMRQNFLGAAGRSFTRIRFAA
jgi:hypothetical protein